MKATKDEEMNLPVSVPVPVLKVGEGLVSELGVVETTDAEDGSVEGVEDGCDSVGVEDTDPVGTEAEEPVDEGTELNGGEMLEGVEDTAEEATVPVAETWERLEASVLARGAASAAAASSNEHRDERDGDSFILGGRERRGSAAEKKAVGCGRCSEKVESLYMTWKRDV